MGKTWKESKGRFDKFDRNNNKRRSKKNKAFKPSKLKPEPSFDEPGYTDNLVDLS